MEKKKGISLLALIITIIVVVILAGAVILNLFKDNPINEANKAVFLNDLNNFQTELEIYKSDQLMQKLGRYDSNLLEADEASITYDGLVDTTKSINDVIPSLGIFKKYAGQFRILNGKLVYQGMDQNKQDWSKQLGIEVSATDEPKVTIIPPVNTLVRPGTDIVYLVKFFSSLPLTTIDLTDKVEILDSLGNALTTAPVVIIGNVTGTSLDAIRQVEVTINTDTLLSGKYNIKVKAGSATNSNNLSNMQDTISSKGFEIDGIGPDNPTMIANPSTWTNGNVDVTIIYSADTVEKEYSLDSLIWNKYIFPISVTNNNTTVYAKGTDIVGNESVLASLTVSNIDKVAPTAVGSDGGSTTSSVTVVASASDNGGSGVNNSTYQYSKDNGSTWTAVTNQTSYTFTGLTTGTYNCRVKVADNAGNISISSLVAITTKALGNVTMSATPTGWTNGNVTVTAAFPTETVTKQYSIDGTTWNTYTLPVVVTNNNMAVYAKGIDVAGNQTAQASLTVANIDKLVPTVTASNGGNTTSSVTVAASASDTGGSGINDSSYQYSKDNGTTWTAVTNQTSYTFSGLATGTYNCKVRAADNAGNLGTSSAVAITTKALGNVVMSASPAVWTNGNVTVTATFPTETVTKQYSTNGTTWNTYTLPVVVTNNNTTVYARGIDDGGNQTAQATLTVTNIDKVAPNVTFSSNGGSDLEQAYTTVTLSDSASGLNVASTEYYWDTQNVTPPSSGWLSFSNGAAFTKGNIRGKYYLWIKGRDIAGNTTTVVSNVFDINSIETYEYGSNTVFFYNNITNWGPVYEICYDGDYSYGTPGLGDFGTASMQLHLEDIPNDGRTYYLTYYYKHLPNVTDYYDTLSIYVNGVPKSSGRLYGENWTKASVQLNPGDNVVRFDYVVDCPWAETSNRLFIDNVRVEEIQ